MHTQDRSDSPPEPSYVATSCTVPFSVPNETKRTTHPYLVNVVRIHDLSIPVRLELSAPPLPLDIETTVYFIAAEALTNVVKHARASQAVVRVEVQGTTLSVDVTDDGIGGAEPGAGNGLAGLADRVGAAEGTLAVTSAAGSGTTVHASLPFAGLHR